MTEFSSSAHQRAPDASAPALARVNRALRLTSGCNQLLVRTLSEGQLLDGICRLLTEAGEYCLAWIGLMDAPAGLRIAAQAGAAQGYLDVPSLRGALAAGTYEPVAAALRTGRVATIGDLAPDGASADWRQAARDHGIQMAVALPLLTDGRRIGVIALCSRESRPLEPDEAKVLLEMAEDVAFGLVRLREKTEFEWARNRLLLLETALKASPHSVMITDLHGIIEWVNPAFTTATGYSFAEAVGKKPQILKSGQQPADYYADLWQTVRAGRNWQGEFVNRRKDGTLYTEEATIAPIRDSAGEIRHFVAIKLDITERKRVEARLAEQAEVIDKAPVAVVITDLANRVTYCNQEAVRLYGVPREELLGRTAEDVFSTDTMRRFAPARESTVRTGAWAGELPLVTRAGRTVHAEIHMTVIRDQAGQPKARLNLATDITEKKNLTEQFLRAQRLENIGMLAAGIAHDLNNVLAPIVMGVPLLRGGVSEQQQAGLLNTLEKSAGRGAGLVRQILGFAHGIGGEAHLVQVRHLLRDAAAVIAETFPKTIRLRDEVGSSLHPVMANPTQIHQVLLNLCVNARDAMPDGGTISLRAENRVLDAAAAQEIPGGRPGTFLCIEVEDTGTGIPPDVLARIWDPFFTTKLDGRGTGLGLATVRGIVQRFNGFVTVDTKVGHGTRFSVYLPAAEGAAEADAPGVVVPRGANELVLVVDDEAVICDLVTTVLQNYGYRAVSARDGIEAVGVFVAQRQEIRLVIADLAMPNLDGVALARVIRRIDPDIPVLAISGVDKMKEVGGDPSIITTFVAKPFRPEALLAEVHRVLHPGSTFVR